MAIFFGGIEDVRKVNWAPKYLWDVRFDDSFQADHVSRIASTSFRDWVPVSDITVEEANLGTYAFELANTGFEIPGNTAQKSMNMTFFDSVDYEIFNWLRTWINIDILNRDSGTFY